MPGVTVMRDGVDFAEVRVADGVSPQQVLDAAVAHGPVLRFEVADPSLEQVFVERVGALQGDERTLAAAGSAA
jgi:ABC-type uncharacterized transport system ATPase subunit